MADKEFTQICKEILGVSKKLEKIEPEELRKIKADIERISEAVVADKAIFDTNKKDFDGKYNKIAEIIKTFDTLKAQIEEVLKNGTINDSAEALISTFSSKKIMDLLNEAKGVVDEKFSTIHKNGITPWNSTLEYPAGAISVLNGKLYQAKTQNTNKNPSENKEIWHVIASKEWCEQTFLNKNDKIDAYTKEESDDKFAPITSLPDIATETKAGITKLKNIINAKQTDVAVTEKAVRDFVAASQSGLGIDQTWQDIKNNRKLGINYTNDTAKPIFIIVGRRGDGSPYPLKVFVSGVLVYEGRTNHNAIGVNKIASVIVPARATYKVEMDGIDSQTDEQFQWVELR